MKTDDLDLSSADLIVIAPKEMASEVDAFLAAAQASGKTVIVATDSPDSVPEQWLQMADDFLFEPFSFKEIVFRLDKKLAEVKVSSDSNAAAGESVDVAVAKRDTFLRALRGLVAIMDAKDAYTRGHSARVSQLGTMLARKMGQPALTQTRMKFAGLFHDIGKIGIPDSIINKPCKLTEEEFAIIAEHPQLGVKIIEQITSDPVIIKAIEYHHERYDGNGGKGLKGDTIPLEARILAVAEAADTMLSKTPYRAALSRELVRAEVRKNKKKQFDPDVANAFLNLNEADIEFITNAAHED